MIVSVNCKFIGFDPICAKWSVEQCCVYFPRLGSSVNLVRIGTNFEILRFIAVVLAQVQDASNIFHDAWSIPW